MFERYTETARRVICFARYEASQFGSPYIETEHLLMGLLREREPDNTAKGLTPLQRNWQPRQDVWSVGQCLEYLRVVNEVYLPAIAASLTARPLVAVQNHRCQVVLFAQLIRLPPLTNVPTSPFQSSATMAP